MPNPRMSVNAKDQVLGAAISLPNTAAAVSATPPVQAGWAVSSPEPLPRWGKAGGRQGAHGHPSLAQRCQEACAFHLASHKV